MAQGTTTEKNDSKKKANGETEISFFQKIYAMFFSIFDKIKSKVIMVRNFIYGATKEHEGLILCMFTCFLLSIYIGCFRYYIKFYDVNKAFIPLSGFIFPEFGRWIVDSGFGKIANFGLSCLGLGKNDKNPYRAFLIPSICLLITGVPNSTLSICMTFFALSNIVINMIAVSSEKIGADYKKRSFSHAFFLISAFLTAHLSVVLYDLATGVSTNPLLALLIPKFNCLDSAIIYSTPISVSLLMWLDKNMNGKINLYNLCNPIYFTMVSIFFCLIFRGIATHGIFTMFFPVLVTVLGGILGFTYLYGNKSVNNLRMWALISVILIFSVALAIILKIHSLKIFGIMYQGGKKLFNPRITVSSQ